MVMRLRIWIQQSGTGRISPTMIHPRDFPWGLFDTEAARRVWCKAGGSRAVFTDQPTDSTFDSEYRGSLLGVLHTYGILRGAYYYAVENGGFQASPERTPGTYSKYNSIDDKIDDFHYYATFIKFSE